MPPIDDGHAVHYSAVERGTPVYGSDEQEVGKVVEVLDNYREHIMDGVVFQTPDGVRRFVDAPEVARTAERGGDADDHRGGGGRLAAPRRRAQARDRRAQAAVRAAALSDALRHNSGKETRRRHSRGETWQASRHSARTAEA